MALLVLERPQLPEHFARDISADSILINCSEENGIDTLRTKIRNYASTVSLNGELKVVIPG
jgi:DNA polymerase III delta prime subunit